LETDGDRMDIDQSVLTTDAEDVEMRDGREVFKIDPVGGFLGL